MEPKKEPLSTADFAKVDEVRGERHENAAGRADVLDPAQAVRRDDRATRPTDADPRNTPLRPQPSAAASATPLFPEHDSQDLRRRWSEVQTAFVDEPRTAVQQADSLVADVMKRLADVFAKERSTLEHQWDRGDNVTTEDLRVALQKYRSFFDRLLAV